MQKDKELTLDEQKQVMLDILSTFAEFCGKNGLTYYLDAGTLIGAVRHKGFIPWDDDMDICMMRDDFNKFLELMKEKDYRLNDHLLVEIPETTIYPFLKIGDTRTKMIEFPDTNPIECYVYIDVFPKDGIQKMSAKSKRLCKRSHIIRLFHWFNKYSIPYWSAKKSGLKKAVAVLAKPFFLNSNLPFRMQQRMIRRYYNKHPLKTCGYVTTLVNGEYHKCAPRECFDETIVLDFEGRKFTAPKGYDTYLHCLYKGDYMELPPEDKRIPHHTVVTWR